MIKNELNIENLFKQKFEKQEVTPPESVWNNIDKSLSKASFWKFSINTFNIFYLSSIIIAGLIIIGLIPKETKTQENAKKITVISEYKEVSKKPIETVIEDKTNEVSKYNNTNENNIISNEKDSKLNSNKEQNQTPLFSQVLKKKDDIIENNNNKQEKTETELIVTKIKSAKSAFSCESFEGCEPFKVQFENNSIGGNTYYWDFGNGETSNELNPNTIFESNGKYTVKLIIKSESGDYTSQREITVNKKPHAEFVIENSNTVFAEEKIKITNYSQQNNSCNWNFGDGQTSVLSNPEHIYHKKGIYDVQLVVLSESGCKDSVTFYDLIVKDSKYKIIAPTAFTPNPMVENDGIWHTPDYTNDIFHPIFSFEVQKYKFRIFNRQGLTVFESSDIKKGWNGYYHNKILPTDVYIWECVGNYSNGRRFYEYGNVTLIQSSK